MVQPSPHLGSWDIIGTDSVCPCHEQSQPVPGPHAQMRLSAETNTKIKRLRFLISFTSQKLFDSYLDESCQANTGNRLGIYWLCVRAKVLIFLIICFLNVFALFAALCECYCMIFTFYIIRIIKICRNKSTFKFSIWHQS